MTEIAAARSLLFVPGSRPDRFAKAAASSADEIVIDLEDAVALEDKASARIAARTWLTGNGYAIVRVNAADPELSLDVESLTGLGGLRGVMVPKAENPEALSVVASRLGVPVLALIETAAGMAAVRSVAAAQGVTRLAIGTIDLALDLGAEEDWEALLLARCELVLASRLAELPGPIDGITTAISSPDVVAEAVARARALGYTGKLCIHPSQLAPVHDSFRPASKDVSWAKEVIAAMAGGSAAAQVHGEMIDGPVLKRAERILARAELYGPRPESSSRSE